METINIKNIMEELSFLKKQNFQIIEELDELKSFRQTKSKFENEVLDRKNNKTEWLSEDESDSFYEEMKARIKNEI